ncbi:MAG: flagellin FliC [Myxococcales bacterium]|nr:flagellin FliC [Myxococcales bacterium]
MSRIATNISSIEGQRHLGKNNTMLNKSLQRLSSGYRINSAMDDAAGLGVSEAMKAQIRGLAQASRNAMDGLSVVQTAESAMGEISDALIRLRELSVQAASDGISDVQRAYLDTEFQDLVQEIDRISTTTNFNGSTLLNGTFGTTGLDFQVGVESGASYRITVTIDDVSSTGLLFTGAEAVDTKLNAQSVMSVIDTALSNLSNARSDLGAKGNRLMMAASAADSMKENLSAANSRIRDTDMAAETANLSKYQVLSQVGTAMLSQANQQPMNVMKLIG